MTRGAAAVLGVASVAAACRGSATVAQTGGTSSGSGASSTGTGASTSSASQSSSGGGTGGQTCAAAAAGIAKASAGNGACTSVVRLDYASLSILGFQLVCGPYAKPTEDVARATAQKDTGFGQSGTSVAGATPADDFVFVVGAADFGGSGVVSAHTGLSVFGGSTVWDGKGDITYPKTWRPAADIGLGCGQSGIPVPSARGFELGGGTPLSTPQVSAALARVWETALPAGIAAGAYFFNAMVLLYPRSVGLSDPTTAEWIVLLDSGFLE